MYIWFENLDGMRMTSSGFCIQTNGSYGTLVIEKIKTYWRKKLHCINQLKCDVTKCHPDLEFFRNYGHSNSSRVWQYRHWKRKQVTIKIDSIIEVRIAPRWRGLTLWVGALRTLHFWFRSTWPTPIIFLFADMLTCNITWFLYIPTSTRLLLKHHRLKRICNNLKSNFLLTYVAQGCQPPRRDVMHTSSVSARECFTRTRAVDSNSAVFWKPLYFISYFILKIYKIKRNWGRFSLNVSAAFLVINVRAMAAGDVSVVL